MYYGPKIFALIQQGSSRAAAQGGAASTLTNATDASASAMVAGRASDSAFLFTAINGVVMVLATVPGILLVDRVGRGVLLRCSAIGMLASCLTLGLAGSTCMHEAACGYAASGAVFFFVANFAYGWGPVVWIYCAEMFPLIHRSHGTGATTMANWAGNFCLAFFPPLLISSIGYATFYVFAVFCLLGLGVACWLPETRGRSLEQVTELFLARGLLLPTATDASHAPKARRGRGRRDAPRSTMSTTEMTAGAGATAADDDGDAHAPSGGGARPQIRADQAVTSPCSESGRAHRHQQLCVGNYA